MPDRSQGPSGTPTVRRLIGIARVVRTAARRPTIAIPLGLFGLVATVVLAVRSAQRIPPIDQPAWWAFAVLIVVTAPLTLALNAAELRAIGQLRRLDIGWMKSFRISVVGSVANLLPLPGSLLVRSTALYDAGMNGRDVGTTNAFAAVLWLASSTAAMGAALLCCRPTIGLVVLVVGVAVIALIVVSSSRFAGWSAALRLLLIELLTVAVTSVRVGIAFVAIDQSVTASSTIVIGGSQPIAAAAGIFPGGLGLRELLAGLLATAVDVSSDSAILSAVVDRVTGLIGLTLVVALVGVGTIKQMVTGPPGG